jgi:vacuolar-type H+-ATPase subunit H
MFWKRAKKPADSIVKLSPLDEIRQAEARAASHLLQARQEAEDAKQAAINQAAQIKAQAQQSGAKAGQARFAILVAEASREGVQITINAQTQAENIKQTRQQSVQEAALRSVQVVLGADWEEQSP